MTVGNAGALLAALLLMPGPAPAADAQESTGPSVSLPDTIRFDMRSAASGRTYRIFVAYPPGPAPERGWPVIYVTDANLAFPIAAAAARLNGTAGRAAIVVGIGYPTDDPGRALSLRNRDLTPETPVDGLPRRPGQPAPSPQDYGGSEAFYRFLVEELRPRIAASHPVDPSAQTLYGHSFGGLFTLGVMFRHPNAFDRYAISSPSIWWNHRAVLRDEQAFVDAVRRGETRPHVSVTVGEMEERPATGPLPPGVTRAELERIAADTRMVGNARELARRLARIAGAPGYRVEFEAFAREDHLSVVPASLGRALSVATAR